MRPTVCSAVVACAGIVLMLAAVPVAAQNNAAVDRYIAARDAAIRQFADAKIDDKVSAEGERARAELELQLRAIVGANAPQGFGAGKLNLTTLFSGDQGFGVLDGLLFAHDIDKDGVIVTTRTLFMRWLRGHKNWWDKESMPAEPRAAFRTEAFYTQAVATDAAIVRFAEIPLGAGGTSYAMLASRTQSEIPNGADEVFVAAIKGERAFIAYQKFAPAIEVASCNDQRAKAAKKLEELSQGVQPEGRAGETFAKKLDAMSGRIEADFKRCFFERGPRQARFGEAATLAKTLFNKMR